MAAENHSPGPVTEQTPAAPGRGLLERVIAVMAFRQGSFREIARAPRTLQSVIVALIGYALVGSVGTLFAMLVLIYPVVVLLELVLSGYVARFVAAKVVGPARSGDLPAYPDWVRAYMFTAAPLALGIVPLLGFVGIIYQLVLRVFSFKDMSAGTTGEAVVILLGSLVVGFLIGVIASLVFGAGLMGLLGLGALTL